MFETVCLCQDAVSRHASVCHAVSVPRLWSDTVDVHRQAVREATLDATAELVAEHGLTSVTMSRIAEETGIGRATLYKYFPNIEAILLAWHERHIVRHLDLLAAARDRDGTPVERLEAVLRAYADITHQSHDNDLATLLHRGEHVVRAQQHLRDLVRDLIAAGAKTGDLRGDIPPGELATYCLHALTAASSAPTKPAVQRLVEVTLTGLQRPS